MRTNDIVVGDLALAGAVELGLRRSRVGGTGSAVVDPLTPGREVARRAPRGARACSVSSAESSGGRWKAIRSTSSSVISSSKRSRKTCSASSFIFFCWWVMFWPSPASPIP